MATMSPKKRKEKRFGWRISQKEDFISESGWPISKRTEEKELGTLYARVWESVRGGESRRLLKGSWEVVRTTGKEEGGVVEVRLHSIMIKGT